MSRDPESGEMDPPECDTPDGVLKRVRVLEQTVNEQTEVLREMAELIVNMTKVFGTIVRGLDNE